MKDSLVMFLNTSAMKLQQITLIENYESCKKLLDKLNAIFNKKSELNRMWVQKGPNDTVAQHKKILNALLLIYRNVQKAWLSVDESTQTVANLTARLLDEEASLVM